MLDMKKGMSKLFVVLVAMYVIYLVIGKTRNKAVTGMSKELIEQAVREIQERQKGADDRFTQQPKKGEPEWMTVLLNTPPDGTFAKRDDKVVTVKDAPIKIISAFLDSRKYALRKRPFPQVKILAFIHKDYLIEVASNTLTAAFGTKSPIRLLVDTGAYTHTVQNIQIFSYGESTTCAWRAVLIMGRYTAKAAPIRAAIVRGEDRSRRRGVIMFMRDERIKPVTADQWTYINVLVPPSRTVNATGAVILDGKAPLRLAAYVPFLSGHTDRDIPHLIDFIETYRMLGVEKFIMYDYGNVSANYAKALDFLRRNTSDIYLIPWSIGLGSEHGTDLSNATMTLTKDNPDECVEMHGINLQYTDVMLRFSSMFDYIIMGDIDDVIVPDISNSFRELLGYLDGNSTLSEYSAFRFVEACYKDKQDDVTSWKIGDSLRQEHLKLHRAERGDELNLNRGRSVIRPAKMYQLKSDATSAEPFQNTITLDSHLGTTRAYRQWAQYKPSFTIKEPLANQDIIFKKVNESLTQFIETL